MDSRQIFTDIFFTNFWGDPESRSGPGSSVSRTRLVRPALSELFKQLQIRSLLDLPCGDFNWMRLTDLPGISYIGADIVPEIVQQNQELYSSESRQFVSLDMVRDPLPAADLILCRDGLVHLSFADIRAALRQFRSSGATYLLTTTFDAHPGNDDIETGHWRPLNMSLPPFSFPPPVGGVWDGPRPDGTYVDKMLALHRIAQLPVL